ncbi:hypothetical protein [Kitasatospora sp. NPDC088134]|uniref:hypothetical protein n=1 Tax=Kitasatospora sp. NPDC088134 TaxID=3364071 RepID=UPI0037F125E2
MATLTVPGPAFDAACPDAGTVTCEEDHCGEEIDRSPAYQCGTVTEIPRDDAHGCGRYFCSPHLQAPDPADCGTPQPQHCGGCLAPHRAPTAA